MDFSKVISVMASIIFSTAVHATSLFDSIQLAPELPAPMTNEDGEEMISFSYRCVVSIDRNHMCQIGYTDEAFTDFTIAPTLAEGGEVKLGLVRMELDLGTNLRIPFSIVVADVTSQTSSDQANAIKLLDPEQGVNFGLDYAWRYRLGNLCSSGESSASCVIGARIGGRYINLKEDVTDKPKDTYGGFVTLENAWAFKIYKYDTEEETGYLRLNVAASYFHHSDVDSNAFFAGITDPSGSAIKFEKNYYSTTLSAALFITNSINISYTKWMAHGSDGLTDQDTVSLNFDLSKLKE